MGWVLYHVKRFWMIRVSGLHFIPHLRSPWLTGELTRPANVRLENESQSGPQVDRHLQYVSQSKTNSGRSSIFSGSTFFFNLMGNLFSNLKVTIGLKTELG